ncbi:MAG TPA: endolytic transglycosylase MltG [Gammaproteobacteria bacterium]|nr:endolytic transglycosylase MltG [Gammaproteobacteria bacterium]
MKYVHYSNRFLLALSVLIIFLVSITLFLIDWEIFLHTPLIPPNTQVDYILPSGSSARGLASDLHQLGFLKRPRYLILLAYMKNYANHLHAGEYRFVAGTTPYQLLTQIYQGKVLWRQITFVEGVTFDQMMANLEGNPLIEHKLAGLPTLLVLMHLGIPHAHAEGLFFPDTYKYTAGMSDQTLLLQAYNLMQKHLNQEWANRSKDAPYTDAYQALTAASIIEKEAEINSDREIISGVIMRRLNKGMMLQMDPTVIYAMGPNFKPPLRSEDLKIDSPYNTYLHTGLPPTPICMPGLPSIHAAMHPASGDVMFFVARGDGTHQFSATYQEQVAAIAKYEH